MAHTFTATHPGTGVWGSTDLPADLDPAQFGFTSYTTLQGRNGCVRYASRSGTSTKKFPFAFVVQVYMGLDQYASSYRVWIPNLPSLLMFLKEIDAHPLPKPDTTNYMEALIDYLKYETYFREALESLHELAELAKKERGDN